MKEIKNIFRDNNEHFKQIVSTYSLEHVLVTAIEVGKFNCQVLIVTMLGDVAAPEFELANSQAGYTLLKNKTLYWDKPRGTPPRDPVLMLRSFLADSIQRFQTSPEPSLKIPQQYFV